MHILLIVWVTSVVTIMAPPALKGKTIPPPAYSAGTTTRSSCASSLALMWVTAPSLVPDGRPFIRKLGHDSIHPVAQEEAAMAFLGYDSGLWNAKRPSNLRDNQATELLTCPGKS
jgi:hypothetical protein